MSDPKGPRAWAARLTLMLNTVLGSDRFPLAVEELALSYSAQIFPGEPIIKVVGDTLPGFDGALMRVPRKGWAIIYNNAVSSPGRVNFTMAHEFGHYLLHRAQNPDGLQCSIDDITGGPASLKLIEREADQFAADLLMPLDDFRRQIRASEAADMEMLSACAHRYRVSFLATALRWLSYTDRRALVVVSRDGFVRWSRSSETALKTGAFIRTSGPPVEIPALSLAARQDLLADNRAGVLQGPGVWFREEAREMTLFSEQYDFAVSLLLLGDAPDWRFKEVDELQDEVASPTDIRFAKAGIRT